MLVLILTLGFLGSAVAQTDLNQFVGTFYPVATIPAQGQDGICIEYQFGTDSTKCTCGSEEIASIKITISGNSIYTPALVANTAETVAENMKRNCTCPEFTSTHLTYRTLSSGEQQRFAIYAKAEDGEPSMTVYAKQIPTAEELNAFMASVDEFKDKEKDTLCTKEIHDKEAED